MSDPSQNAKPSREVAKADYKPNLDALVPHFVETLKSPASHKPARDKAVEELTLFTCSRLTALAEYIDHTAAGDKTILDTRSGRIKKAIETATFLRQHAPKDARDFYQRAATAIREWLIARLETLRAACENPCDGLSTELRLKWWCEFHRQAANLPEHPRAVHDLMYYFRLTARQAAAVLGKRLDVVEMDRDVAVYMLRPLFDKARGKS